MAIRDGIFLPRSPWQGPLKSIFEENSIGWNSYACNLCHDREKICMLPKLRWLTSMHGIMVTRENKYACNLGFVEEQICVQS